MPENYVFASLSKTFYGRIYCRQLNTINCIWFLTVWFVFSYHTTLCFSLTNIFIRIDVFESSMRFDFWHLCILNLNIFNVINTKVAYGRKNKFRTYILIICYTWTIYIKVNVHIYIISELRLNRIVHPFKYLYSHDLIMTCALHFSSSIQLFP